jgi:hypothetical protein
MFPAGMSILTSIVCRENRYRVTVGVLGRSSQKDAKKRIIYFLQPSFWVLSQSAAKASILALPTVQQPG